MEEIKDGPLLVRIRDWKLITTESLINAIEKNKKLMSIFKYLSQNIVANTIVEEFDRIINEIAPPKIIKARADYLKYHTNLSLDLKAEAEESLDKAISDNTLEAWRYFTSV